MITITEKEREKGKVIKPSNREVKVSWVLSGTSVFHIEDLVGSEDSFLPNGGRPPMKDMDYPVDEESLVNTLNVLIKENWEGYYSEGIFDYLARHLDAFDNPSQYTITIEIVD